MSFGCACLCGNGIVMALFIVSLQQEYAELPRQERDFGLIKVMDKNMGMKFKRRLMSSLPVPTIPLIRNLLVK